MTERNKGGIGWFECRSVVKADCTKTRSRSEVEGSRIPLLDSFCSSTNLGHCEILSARVSHDQPPI